MIRLSAFADEISPDLDEQIAVLSSEKVHFLDLRSVWNTNVLDLSDQQVARIKETLDAHGIGVAAIGSPIGKVPIDSSFDEHLHHFRRYEKEELEARIQAAGYTQVSDIKSTAEGITAKAVKNGKSVTLVVDSSGQLKERN